MQMQDNICTVTTVPPKRAITDEALAEIFSSVLGMDVDADDDFFAMGGASLQAASLFSQIEKRLGAKLPMAMLIQYSTARSLATAIEKIVGPAEQTTLIPIQPSGNRPPLFLIHPLDGSVIRYRTLAALLPDQPVYGLQYPDQDKDDIPSHTVVELAERYIADIRKEFPHGPYCIGGYSFGGHVALEMAARLKAAGEEVPLLVILDSIIERIEATFDAKIASFLSGLGEVPTSEWPAYFWHKTVRLVTGRRTGPYMPADFANRDVPTAVIQLKEIIRAAGRGYSPPSYDGPTFFVSAISRPWQSTQQVIRPWRAILSGTLEHFFVRTRHLQLLDEPSLSQIAEKLAQNLKNATTN
ncbi:MAG: thioesterase domain-containing protein [Alphaproteobacteria bacterium]